MTGGDDRIYPMAATAAIAFIVWGSLFPFVFHPMSFTEATTLFLGMGGGVGQASDWSITDFLSNTLLFGPMGLLLSATLRRTWPPRRRLIFVVSTGFLLSLAVEFGQVFVVWRTPSLADVVAATMGTAIGYAVWRFACGPIDDGTAAIETVWRSSSRVEQALLLYAGIFACAWLFPFDVTIRPAEIRDKYEHQRLLLPLSPSPDAATPTQLMMISVAAVPLGIAASVCGSSPGARRSLPRAAVLATAGMFALEIAQVPVFSRNTDAMEFIAAIPGIALGATAARLTNVTRRQDG